jgi:putative oxidoreductase
MERWLGRYSEVCYALLRLVAGFLFACHGAQKLFGALGAEARQTAPLMLTAGVIEFFGGVLVAIGLAAGWAAFIASGQMAVAYVMAHAPNSFWPILNHGELAVLYCVVFLFIASRGSGRFSVEAMLKRGRP